MYDKIIKKGNIFLHKAAGWFQGDIAIKDKKIAALQKDIPANRASQIIQAEGQVVTAGFIDVHTHDEMEILQTGTVKPKIHQGVTTSILGNCGLGFYPLKKEREKDLKDYNSGIFSLDGVEFDWENLAGFAGKLRKKGLGINAASLVAHGAIRLAVMGFADRPASESELEEMGRLLAETLDQGALGMSTGLLYPPSSYATEAEIKYLAGMLAERGRIYTTHLRNESDGLKDCIQANIDLARQTGVSVEISHLNLSGRSIWGRAGEYLDMLRQARAEGLNIHADQYPYQAGSTLITALLPQWALAEGVEELLKRLEVKEFRQKLAEDIEEGIPGWDNIISSAEWENIIISSVPSQDLEQYRDKSLKIIADIERTDKHTALFDLIQRSQGRMTVLIFSTSQEDVDVILADSEVLVGSDGLSINGNPHPRLYGTYPRILGRQVREHKILSLEDALYKMTELPAFKFGLRERGTISPGKAADLVIFDPERVEDRATYAYPSRLAVGFKAVLVNGDLVLQDDELIDEETPGDFICL
ncbi:MAG: N-acyl-D-amino-acid deacylase family protein [Bacillota bacterium]